MRLTVNGEPVRVQQANNVAELLSTLNLHEKRVAVEINSEIIPRSEHPTTRVREGDRVEIVRAIGGG
ncbi:sulfur carrier protein ThiS [Neptunomonas marina]|uniref:Sulfur carrier protein ThiS n=1 Tax=Neptunomonas marina TaxID=1815562 RepID=A0A437QEU5_9GAMM|nr:MULTISPECIES: sulfur carrier protein ThiS [Neptunomonas]RVU32975.1 sulfur carrier protein ThiS [Neptunomonas marina]